MTTAEQIRPARSNKYGAECVNCGGHVAAMAGTLAGKTDAGRWAVRHTDCSTTPVFTTPSGTASARQLGYLRSLIARVDRLHGNPWHDIDGGRPVITDDMTASTATALIADLKEMF